MVLRGRSAASLRQNCVTVFSFSKNHFSSPSGRWSIVLDRKSGSAGMPRPTSYAVFCLKKKTEIREHRMVYRVRGDSEQQVRRTLGRLGTVRLSHAHLCTFRMHGTRDSIRRRPDCGHFFFNDTATTEIYTLSLHDALPI